MLKRVIFLDIGHGENTYDETGSKGVPGLEEHHFNAAVGKYMKTLLEDNGFVVYFTQEPNQKDVPLTTRVKSANAIYASLTSEEKKNCIFFSIHADANGDPNRRGHWCFYYGPGKDNEGKRLAKLVTDEMNFVTGTEQVGDGIRGCFPNIKWPSFYVVLNTSMTAVLHEHAFMTNKDDLKLLQSEEFRKKCAEANVRAIRRYLNIIFKGFVKPVVKEAVKKMERDVNYLPSDEKIKKEWEEAKVNGYFDGTRPNDLMPRYEVAIVVNRMRRNFKEFVFEPMEKRIDQLEKELTDLKIGKV